MDVLTQAANRSHDSESPDPYGADRTGSPGGSAGGPAITGRKSTLLAQLNALTNDFVQRKDHHFAIQLRQLQEDLSRLHDSSHPGYLSEVSELRDIRDEQLYIAREEGNTRLGAAREDYDREVAAADKEYEESRSALRHELVAHLQAKRRRLEQDKSMLDIGASYLVGGSSNPHATRTQATSTTSAAAPTATTTTTAPQPPTNGNTAPIDRSTTPFVALTKAGAAADDDDAASATGSRKLRHRLPVHPGSPMLGGGTEFGDGFGFGNGVVGVGGPRYPVGGRGGVMETRTQLDEMLVRLGDQIRQRKGYSGAGAEDRARDRIEREREKLVRTMLDGAKHNDIEDDLALIRRRIPGATSSIHSTAPVVAPAAGTITQKRTPSSAAAVALNGGVKRK
ncbi:hypothetical protein PYCC9005_002042 [Savitreella phatthalungensis]